MSFKLRLHFLDHVFQRFWYQDSLTLLKMFEDLENFCWGLFCLFEHIFNIFYSR